MKKLLYAVYIVLAILFIEVLYLFFIKKDFFSVKKNAAININNIVEENNSNSDSETPTPTLTAIQKYPISNKFLEGVSRNLTLLINTNDPLNFILHKYALYLFLKPYDGKIKSNAIVEYDGIIDTIDYDLSRKKECLDPFALVKQPYTLLIKIKKNNTYHEFCFDKITEKMDVKNIENKSISITDLKKNDSVLLELNINLLETKRFNDGVNFTIIKK